MKKIMFNDRYGLTKAVLEGRKTMTRRIVPDGTPLGNWEETEKMSRFKPGEVVAVAQNYKDAGLDPKNCDKFQLVVYGDFPPRHHHGWTNKMFVAADLMPHQIRITNVKVERLQDISDEDCMREGVYETVHHSFGYPPSEALRTFSTKVYERYDAFSCPRNAFAALINKVSGEGTWASNPWVFVYEFELVK